MSKPEDNLKPKGNSRERFITSRNTKTANILAGLEKAAAELSSKRRNSLPDDDFALPGRRYPIHDRVHARNALARVAQHGTSSERATVERKVKQRFPDID